MKANPFSGMRAFPALQHRNYRLYYSGQLISTCGTWMQTVAQGWLVWQLTHNEVWSGVVVATSYASMLIFSLIGGSIADRYDRRMILLVTQSVSLLLAAVLGTLTLLPGLRVWHVALIAAASGIVNAVDLPTRHAFLAEIVRREHLMSAVSLNATLFNSARIIGPAIASLLVTVPYIKIPGCFYINAFSYLAAIFALAKIRRPERAISSESTIKSSLGGVRYVLKNPTVRHLILLVMFVGIFGWSLSVILPSIAERELGGGARLYSILMTGIGLGAVIGSLALAYARNSNKSRQIIYTGLALWATSIASFSLSSNVILSVFLAILIGIGMILFSTTCNTVIQTTVPDELRGRVMGIWSLVFAVSEPIGSIQAGTLARLWGAPMALQFGATLMAGAGLLSIRLSQKSKFRESPQVE